MASCAYAVTLRDAALVFLREVNAPAAAQDVVSANADKASFVVETEEGIFSFYAMLAPQDDDPDVLAELEAGQLNIASVRARENLILHIGGNKIDRKRYADGQVLGGALDIYFISKGISGIQSASEVTDGWVMALAWVTRGAGEVFRAALPFSEDINEKYCELLYSMTKRSFDAGRYSDALLAFKQIHDLKWSNIGLYLDTSDCFIKVNGKEDARKLLAELVSVLGDKMSSDDYVRAGTLFRAAGDRKSALSSFKKARELYHQGK
jgi:tetratricopeptide (TPR) repeat protein